MFRCAQRCGTARPKSRALTSPLSLIVSAFAARHGRAGAPFDSRAVARRLYPSELLLIDWGASKSAGRPFPRSLQVHGSVGRACARSSTPRRFAPPVFSSEFGSFGRPFACSPNQRTVERARLESSRLLDLAFAALGGPVGAARHASASILLAALFSEEPFKLRGGSLPGPEPNRRRGRVPKEVLARRGLSGFVPPRRQRAPPKDRVSGDARRASCCFERDNAASLWGGGVAPRGQIWSELPTPLQRPARNDGRGDPPAAD